MHVKIHNEHPAHAAVLHGVPCGHGHTVEQAVAVELLLHGVVARRSNQGQPILHPALGHSGRDCQGAPCGQACRSLTSRVQVDRVVLSQACGADGLGVVARLGSELLQGREVARSVDEEEFFVGSFPKR